MRKYVLIWVGLALLLGACGSGSSDVVITEDDNLEEVLVDSGDEFEIRLESNATTGYQWVVTESGWPDMVELMAEDFEVPESTLVGAPGHQVFQMRATEEGAGILRLEYIRPFDDPPVPDRIVEFVLRVDGAPWPPEDIGIPPGTAADSVS